MRTVKLLTLAFSLVAINLNISGQTEANTVPKAPKLYKDILKSSSVELCNLYLENYANDKKAEEVATLKEKYEFINAYTIAAEDFSDTALKSFVERYPEGIYVKQAKDAIEVTAWQNAYSTNTVESYKNYLNAYPEGKAVELAKKSIKKLE